MPEPALTDALLSTFYMRTGNPMFTIKPANDTEDFYKAVKLIEDQPKIKNLWQEMEDAYSGRI